MGSSFRRELIVSSLFIIGGTIVISLALYLLFTDMTSQTDKIVTDRTLISDRTQAIGALADLKKNAAEARAYKQAMDKILVSKDQLLDFSKWLDGLARARQIGYNFTFDNDPTPPQGDAPGFIGFSLDLNGQPANVIDFIKDVETRAPRFLVSLDTFDLSRTDQNYRIVSRGKVYFK